MHSKHRKHRLVFRSEFWSVKFIETMDFFQVLFRYFKDTDLTETLKAKQKLKYEASYWTVYNFLLIVIVIVSGLVWWRFTYLSGTAGVRASCTVR